MKVFLLSTLAVVCLAEPPVDNQYLPPQQRGEARPLSAQYGAPIRKKTDALFGKPSTFTIITNEYGPPKLSTYIPPDSQYDPPKRQLPNTQYGVPSSPSSKYGAPSTSSSKYGVPSSPSNKYGVVPSTPSSKYGIVPSTPSNKYGVASTPSSNYGVPPTPSNKYVAPSTPSNKYVPPSTPSNKYRVPSTPSSKYEVPSSTSNKYVAPSTPSSKYGVPSSTSNKYVAPSTPSNKYVPPSTPSNKYRASSTPSSKYGVPSSTSNKYVAQSTPSSKYGGPSSPLSSYGALDFSDIFTQDKFRGREQNREYLPPGTGGRKAYRDDEDNGEPVNYSFEYMVLDERSGNDFGHRETRQNERAEGLYYVLLPDGRKLTVEYVADDDGYQPKLSYEETGSGDGDYGKGSQNGFNGY